MKKSRILAGLVSAVSTVSLMASVTANAAQIVYQNTEEKEKNEQIATDINSCEVETNTDLFDTPHNYDTIYRLPDWTSWRPFNMYEIEQDDHYADYTFRYEHVKEFAVKYSTATKSMYFREEISAEEAEALMNDIKNLFPQVECTSSVTLNYETATKQSVMINLKKATTVEEAEAVADYIFANYDNVKSISSSVQPAYYKMVAFMYDYWTKFADNETDIMSDEEFISLFNQFCAENDIEASIETSPALNAAMSQLNVKKMSSNTYHMNFGFDLDDTEKLYTIIRFMKSYGYSCESPALYDDYKLPKDVYYHFVPDDYELPTVSADTADVLAPEAVTLLGDANCDGKVDISDAVLIMQFLANPEKYPISAQGLINADIVGNDGVTALDALQIQMMEAGSVD